MKRLSMIAKLVATLAGAVSGCTRTPAARDAEPKTEAAPHLADHTSSDPQAPGPGSQADNSAAAGWIESGEEHEQIFEMAISTIRGSHGPSAVTLRPSDAPAPPETNGPHLTMPLPPRVCAQVAALARARAGISATARRGEIHFADDPAERKKRDAAFVAEVKALGLDQFGGVPPEQTRELEGPITILLEIAEGASAPEVRLVRLAPKP